MTALVGCMIVMSAATSGALVSGGPSAIGKEKVEATQIINVVPMATPAPKIHFRGFLAGEEAAFESPGDFAEEILFNPESASAIRFIVL